MNFRYRSSSSSCSSPKNSSKFTNTTSRCIMPSSALEYTILTPGIIISHPNGIRVCAVPSVYLLYAIMHYGIQAAKSNENPCRMIVEWGNEVRQNDIRENIFFLLIAKNLRAEPIPAPSRLFRMQRLHFRFRWLCCCTLFPTTLRHHPPFKLFFLHPLK